MIEQALLQICALLIGVSKAGFGGGLGALVPPLLAMVIPGPDVLGLMLPLLFGTDVVALFYYWRRWDARNVLLLVPSALTGIVLCTPLLLRLSDKQISKGIGAVAIGFAVYQLLRERKGKGAPDYVPTRPQGIAAGLTTGFLSTLSHQGGLVTTLYLLPQRLANDVFVATTTVVYFAINGAKLPVFVEGGLIRAELLRQDALLVPTLLLGIGLGIWLNQRTPGVWLRVVVLVGTILTGAKLLVG